MWGNQFSPFSYLGNKMKLSFETKNKLSWQQWNQVCLPMELSLCLLPDLSLGRSLPFFWILRGSQGTGVSWWMCSAWIWVPWMSRKNTRNQHRGSPHVLGDQPHPSMSLMAGCPLKMCFCRMRQREPHVKGQQDAPWTRCAFIPLYSSWKLPLQPRCCNWDMGAWSCLPQQASHEKAAYSSNLRTNKSSITSFLVLCGRPYVVSGNSAKLLV